MPTYINKPPNASNFVQSLRRFGYSFSSALADIIDNSIFAKSSEISITYYPKETYLTILDNGLGMDKDELEQAMELGSGNPSATRDPKDLGRFGCGLKTASFSQSTRLIVLSKKNKNLNGAIWDLDAIQNDHKSWQLGILNSKEVDIYIKNYGNIDTNSGTLVIWENIDSIDIHSNKGQSTQNNKIKIAKQDISLIFHRFIGKNLKIFFNHENLESLNPFLVGKSYESPIQKISIDGTDKIIYMQGFTLPAASRLTSEELRKAELDKGLSQTQGFYIYRNNRLITYGGWLGLERYQALTNLSRVKVDVPNSLDDSWQTDVKKTTMIPPPGVLNAMKTLLDRFHDPSKTIHKRKAGEAIKNSKIWLRSENRNDEQISANYHIDKNSNDFTAVKTLINKSSYQTLEKLINNIEEGLPHASIFADWADGKINK